MFKRMAFMLVTVAIVFGAIFGFETFKAKMISHAIAALRNPPQAVSAVTARPQEWATTLKAVGSTKAVQGANLSPQVSGIVSGLHFQSGTDVTKGDLLVELTAAADVAHLDALKASGELAQLNYDRDRALNANAITRQQVDTDLATLKNDQAQVAQQQALVDYKSIRAPFSGRLGIRQVDLGEYIAPGTSLVTLQQINPIYVDFYLPQKSLSNIKVGQPVTITVDAYAGTTFSGKISSMNSLVDSATRTVQVRATVDNAEKKLLPGMFVDVEIDLGQPHDYITLPKTAITYNSYGNLAYLIERNERGKAEGVARQTFVTTGPTRGDQIAVLDGIKAGDLVVTAGQMKLRNGSPVTINNAVQPPSQPNPKLTEE
jgi:membrane fusion protein (multidrug efflux system)